MSNDNATTQDGQGFLVGVTPAQPQNSGNWVPQQRPDQAVSQQTPLTVVDTPVPPTNGDMRFREEDLERARQQEKEKLYPRIEEMSEALKALRAERDAEAAERQRLAQEAEEARRIEEEKQMEVRDLLDRREQEWQSRFTELSTRYDTDRAIFERERSLNEAREYRLARIEQESEFILPELRDLIRGNTPEEVDASIEEMKQRSEMIFNNMAAAAQPQPFRGAAMPSVPPVGPLEQMPEHNTLSAEDIRTMDFETYKRYRPQLLQAASQQQRRGQR